MKRIDLITLQQIRDAEPCKDGWEKLLLSLGGSKTPLSTVVSIGDVAKSNGIRDALWCCRVIDDEKFIVSIILPAVKRSSKHTEDKRVHDSIVILDKWLAGDDTVDLKTTYGDVSSATYGDISVTAYNAAHAAVYAVFTAHVIHNTHVNYMAYAATSYNFAADTASAAVSIGASDGAYAAYATERKHQVEDIIKLSPLHALKQTGGQQMTRVDLITLQQIRDAKPCKDGWDKFLSSLGGPNNPLTTVVSIGDIAKSNGSQDALWCCRIIDDRRFLVSLIMPAVKRAVKRTVDKRAHDSVMLLDKWLAGDDTVDLVGIIKDLDFNDPSYGGYITNFATHIINSTVHAASNICSSAIDSADAAIDTVAYAAGVSINDDVERKLQVEDIISLSPLHALK